MTGGCEGGSGGGGRGGDGGAGGGGGDGGVGATAQESLALLHPDVTPPVADGAQMPSVRDQQCFELSLWIQMSPPFLAHSASHSAADATEPKKSKPFWSLGLPHGDGPWPPKPSAQALPAT